MHRGSRSISSRRGRGRNRRHRRSRSRVGCGGHRRGGRIHRRSRLGWQLQLHADLDLVGLHAVCGAEGLDGGAIGLRDLGQRIARFHHVNILAAGISRSRTARRDRPQLQCLAKYDFKADSLN